MVFTALEGLGSRFRLLHLVQRVLNPSVCYWHLVCVYQLTYEWRG